MHFEVQGLRDEVRVPIPSFSALKEPHETLCDLAVQNVKSNKPSKRLKFFQGTSQDVSSFSTNEKIVEDVTSGKIKLTSANMHRLNAKEALALRKGIPLASIQDDVKAAIANASTSESKRKVLSLLLLDTESHAADYVFNLVNEADTVTKAGILEHTPWVPKKIIELQQKLKTMDPATRLSFMAAFKFAPGETAEAGIARYTKVLGDDLAKQLRSAKHLTSDHDISIADKDKNALKDELQKIKDPKTRIDLMRTWSKAENMGFQPPITTELLLAQYIQGRQISNVDKGSVKSLLEKCLSSMDPKSRLDWMASWNIQQCDLFDKKNDKKYFTEFRTAKRLHEIGEELSQGLPLKLKEKDFMFSDFFKQLTEHEKIEFLAKLKADTASSSLKNSGFIALFKVIIEFTPIFYKQLAKQGKGEVAEVSLDTTVRMREFMETLNQLDLTTKVAVLSQLPVHLQKDKVDTTVLKSLIDGELHENTFSELRIAQYLGGKIKLSDLYEHDIFHLQAQLYSLKPKARLDFMMTYKLNVLRHYSEQTKREIDVAIRLQKARQGGNPTELDKQKFQDFLQSLPMVERAEFLKTWENEAPAHIKNIFL